MKKIIVVILALLMAIVVGVAEAQEWTIASPAKQPESDLMMPIDLMESQSYTHVVNKDGTSRVWLRVDNFVVEKGGREFRYNLPEKAMGEARVWYRDDGCVRWYDKFSCAEYNPKWVEISTKMEERAVVVEVPWKDWGGNKPNQMSIGLVYTTSDITTKTWWGRMVEITNGTTDSYVQYMNLGVYVPEGLWVRDEQSAPGGWSNGVTAMFAQPMAIRDEKAAWYGGATTMFDSIGGGELIRERRNLAPGESYSFEFMSSGKNYLLYYKEIGQAVLWLLAISVVVTLLLYMLVGKKPLWWYGALVLLLFTLMILVAGLWINARALAWVSGSRYSPSMMFNEMEGQAQTSEVQEVGGGGGEIENSAENIVR